MQTLPMLCETYNEISQKAYKDYLEAVHYLKSLGCAHWDMLDHTAEENEKYTEAMQQREKSAITAIVFQALAVEAFVNLYGAQRVGEDKYYADYESKDAPAKERTTEGKLKKICKEYLNKPYPTNDKAYSRLISLLNKRDSIVHTKPRAVIIDGEHVSYDDFMSQTEYIYKNIDEELESYENLKENMRQLEGKEHDLIEENFYGLYNGIKDNFEEMLSKALFGNREVTTP